MDEHLPEGGEGDVPAAFERGELPALDAGQLRELFLAQTEVFSSFPNGFMEQHVPILAQIVHLIAHFPVDFVFV
jgi:hypothetical protein